MNFDETAGFRQPNFETFHCDANSISVFKRLPSRHHFLKRLRGAFLFLGR